RPSSSARGRPRKPSAPSPGVVSSSRVPSPRLRGEGAARRRMRGLGVRCLPTEHKEASNGGSAQGNEVRKAKSGRLPAVSERKELQPDDLWKRRRGPQCRRRTRGQGPRPPALPSAPRSASRHAARRSLRVSLGEGGGKPPHSEGLTLSPAVSPL